MSTPTATPRTQALWMKHHAFFTEEEATEALCDFRDHGNLLETELAAASQAYDCAMAIHGTVLEDLAAEREKVRVLREALQAIVRQSGEDYDERDPFCGVSETALAIDAATKEDSR